MSAVLAIVLIVAGLRLIDGQMSVGALIGILGMTAFLTEPMRALAEIVGLFAQSHGAAERIARLLGDIDAGVEKDSTASGPDVSVSDSVVTVTGWPGSGDEFTTAGGETDLHRHRDRRAQRPAALGAVGPRPRARTGNDARRTA
jgi:ABC-type multidrug transport system fused ATPase/permease subunit